MSIAITVTVEIDGQTLDVRRDCIWLQYCPCGCICGAIITEHGAENGGLLLTAEQAWVAYEPNAKRRKKDHGLGYRLELRPRGDVMQLQAVCPHDPKWGYPRVPIPDGYVEASLHEARVLHLVQSDQIAVCPPPESPGLRAFCGFRRRWSTWYAGDAWHRDLDLCARCEKKAFALAAKPRAEVPT